MIFTFEEEKYFDIIITFIKMIYLQFISHIVITDKNQLKGYWILILQFCKVNKSIDFS